MQYNSKLIMKLFQIYSLFIMIFITSYIKAQDQNKNDFSAKVFVDKGKILIRWVPTNSLTFELAKKYGYKIDRITLSNNLVPKDTSAFTVSYKVTLQTLFPLDEKNKKWLELFEKNEGTAIVYDALFKKNKTTETTQKDKENADKMKFGLVLLSCDLDLNLAKATGLYCEDENIDNKSIYAYRITLGAPKGVKYKPYIFTIDSKQLTKLAKINKLKSKSGIKSTKLSWNVSENKHDYTGYIFERSNDSITFERTNKTPFVFMTSQYNRDLKEGVFTDSLPQSGVIYFYRVRGLSHFGILGEPSNVVRCIGKSGFNTYPYIDSVSTIKNKTINVYFHMPNYNLNKLKGYCLYRASSVDGKYELITKNNLPSNATVFTDEKPMMSNYYKVFAINIENDSVSSHPTLGQLADEDPPSPPKGLRAAIDTTGKVILSWDKNTEKDLKGYRVYKMNTLKEEPVEVVSKYILENNFVDTITLNTLTEDIYYTINAVDNSYNNSKQCAPIKLKKPDRIPPVKPIITKLFHTDTTMILTWINSTSKDVVRTELFQISNNKKTKLREFCPPDSTSKHIDYLIENGQSYSYEIIAIDDDGNKSSMISNPMLFETGVRPKIKNIEFIVDYDHKQIHLKWEYSQKDLYNFTIYKSKGNNTPFYTYKTLSPTQFNFFDKDLEVSNIYKYKIKAIFNSGAESIISDEIEIKY